MSDTLQVLLPHCHLRRFQVLNGLNERTRSYGLNRVNQPEWTRRFKVPAIRP